MPSMPRIERLRLSDVVLSEGHPAATQSRSAVVFGFVIDHPDGAIVVDTGVGRGNEFIDELYSPNVAELETAIRKAGIEPKNVSTVVNSHLHVDHCGQNPLYYGTHVPVFVQAEEVVAAHDRYYTVAEWVTIPWAGTRRWGHAVALMLAGPWFASGVGQSVRGSVAEGA